MSRPRVSVIILCYNNKKFLKDLFTGLDGQTYPKDKFEVIMVDNNSTLDDSVAYTKKNFPWVNVIENPHNDGFTGGNNVGMRVASGEYLILLNSDTKPTPDWLAELVKVADDKKAGAVVSKLMFNHDRTIINNAGSFLHPTWTSPVTEQGINEKDHGQYDHIQEITSFCGASVLLSRKMLEQIGLFDEYFFMYYEDTDLAWRGYAAGWKYYLAPKSVVYHVHAGTNVVESSKFKFHVSRNRVLVLVKNAKLWVACKSFLAAIMRDRLYYGAKYLLSSIIHGRGRRDAAENMWVGIKVFFSALILIPVMLAKRWHLLKEEQI